MDDRSPSATEAVLEFDRFRVLVRRRQLLADGVPVELGTRAFDLLLVLIRAGGRLVSKDELLSQVWPNTVVGENNLQVQISSLRKVLGKDHDLIRTEFGRGYRFTGEMRVPPGSPEGPAWSEASPAASGPNAGVPAPLSATLADLIDNDERLLEILRLLASQRVVTLTISPHRQSAPAPKPGA
jgi:DNA-binding winged helix-turn-helix (wHTH) protein